MTLCVYTCTCMSTCIHSVYSCIHVVQCMDTTQMWIYCYAHNETHVALICTITHTHMACVCQTCTTATTTLTPTLLTHAHMFIINTLL